MDEVDEITGLSACPSNSVTLLRFYFDHNSEMERPRELSDVLN
jgi:hypothetical protein